MAARSLTLCDVSYYKKSLKKSIIAKKFEKGLKKVGVLKLHANQEMPELHSDSNHWDISTVDVYNAIMIRLHYVNSSDQATADAEVGRTLWLTSNVAKQLISILEDGIAKIESTEHLD